VRGTTAKAIQTVVIIIILSASKAAIRVGNWERFLQVFCSTRVFREEKPACARGGY
jgi:hypothetical protein